MGKLVFQATLGGQVNLVGPNTASTYDINVPAVAGNMVTTGDTGTVTNTMCATSVYTAPGTIGSGTPNTGAFTTLSATGNVTLGDATTDTLNVGAGGLVKDASGNVGIGTASPAVKLDVNGTSQSLFKLTTTNSEANINFNINGSTNNFFGITGGANFFWNTGGTERMRLDASGNLGIGTDTPTTVAGTALCVYNSSAPRIRLTNSTTGNTSTVGGELTIAGSDFIMENRTASANIRFYNNGSERARIDSSGNLLVGTTSQISNEKFGVVQTSGAGYWATVNKSTDRGYLSMLTASSGINLYFQTSTTTYAGQISTSGATTAFTSASDYRLKENVRVMEGGLAKVMSLRPVNFNFIEDKMESQGFIAHELQAIVPEAVVGEKDAVNAEGNPIYQSVDTSFLVATLTAAIQEQQALITQLQADVAALKAA